MYIAEHGEAWGEEAWAVMRGGGRWEENYIVTTTTTTIIINIWTRLAHGWSMASRGRLLTVHVSVLSSCTPSISLLVAPRRSQFKQESAMSRHITLFWAVFAAVGVDQSQTPHKTGSQKPHSKFSTGFLLTIHNEVMNVVLIMYDASLF
jgi:hypothetical protein